jgi:hypothetical protein
VAAVLGGCASLGPNAQRAPPDDGTRSTEVLADEMDLVDGHEVPDAPSRPVDDPCAPGAAATQLSSGAVLACGERAPSEPYTHPDLDSLEEQLGHATGEDRAPLLRRLAETAFAWECDASRSLARLCALSPPQTAAADAFRRVAVHTRRAAFSYCRELQREHASYGDQCPSPAFPARAAVAVVRAAGQAPSPERRRPLACTTEPARAPLTVLDAEERRPTEVEDRTIINAVAASLTREHPHIPSLEDQTPACTCAPGDVLCACVP